MWRVQIQTSQFHCSLLHTSSDPTETGGEKKNTKLHPFHHPGHIYQRFEQDSKRDHFKLDVVACDCEMLSALWFQTLPHDDPSISLPRLQPSSPRRGWYEPSPKGLHANSFQVHLDGPETAGQQKHGHCKGANWAVQNLVAQFLEKLPTCLSVMLFFWLYVFLSHAIRIEMVGAG